MCSMISGQCDELRKTADELDERAKAYAPTGRNVLSPMLRTAADTIWELRCKLADMVDQRDEIERLKTENTKLRELFEKTYGYYVSGTLTTCDFCKRLDCEGNAPTTCEADEYDPNGIVNNEIERLMRELGIEVDG